VKECETSIVYRHNSMKMEDLKITK